MLRTLLGALALAVALSTPAPAKASRSPLPPPVAPLDGLTLAARAGRIDEAQDALQRALAIFDRDRVMQRFGWVAPTGPRGGTMALLDLALRLDRLSPGERAEGERLLARPTDPGSNGAAAYDAAARQSLETWCGPYCVTWAEAGRDAPPLVDIDANGRPDYIDTVIKVMDTVWAIEIDAMGYRPPKSDDSSPDPTPHGPQLDVYVLDLLGRTQGIVGYCATDDPSVGSASYPGLDASAYCVFDDDYAEYGSDARILLEATAAHEFFHAVQFAYNARQDRWLMEGTATWIEDEVFDDANDNYNYLDTSQVADPTVPLDLFAPSSTRIGGFAYGNYAFFQLLTDSHGHEVVREMFERGDGVPGEPGHHSLIAVPAAMAAHGIDFADFYNRFALANWWPPAFYEEGASWVSEDGSGRQLAVPHPRPSTLTPRKQRTTWKTSRLDHLTSGYAAFVPGEGTGPARRLEVTVDLSHGGAGARASLIAESRSGRFRVIPIRLTAARTGTAVVERFGRLRSVALVLSNGSTRIRDCGSDRSFPIYACSGDPIDEDRPFRFQARLR